MKKIRAFLGFLSIFVFTVFAANPAFAADELAESGSGSTLTCSNDEEVLTLDENFEYTVSNIHNKLLEGCGYTNENYTGFEIWGVDADGNYSDTSLATCNFNDVCTFENNEYETFDFYSLPGQVTLNFSCGNGTGTIEPQTSQINNPYDTTGLEKNCSYAGYYPTGWLSSDGTIVNINEQISVGETGETYTLQWERLSTLTFDINDGSWSGPSSGQYATYPTITPYGYPTRSGYVFTGFYTASSGGTQVYNVNLNLNYTYASTVITSNTTLYAQWAQAECVQEGEHFDGDAKPTISNNTVSCNFQCDNYYSPSTTPSGGTVTATCVAATLSDSSEKIIALDFQGGSSSEWTYSNLYYLPTYGFVCTSKPCTIENVIASADGTINNPIQANLLPSRKDYTFAGFYVGGPHLGDLLNGVEKKSIAVNRMFISHDGYVNMGLSSINSLTDVYAIWVQNCNSTAYGCSPSFTENGTNIDLSYTCDAGYEYNKETGTCVEKIELCDEGSSCDTYTFFFFEKENDAIKADGYSYPQDVIDAGLKPSLTLTFNRESDKQISISDILATLETIDVPYYINEQWVDNTGFYSSVEDYLSDGEDEYYHSSFYIGAELPVCNNKTPYIKTDGTCGECPNGTEPSADGASFNNTCVKKDHYTCTGTFVPDAGEGITCTADEYEITYLANGKSIYPDGAPTKCTVDSDDITLPTNLTVNGYIFKGWKNDSNVLVDKISKGTCTSDKTFTAKLVQDAPTLTYNLTLPVNTGFSGGKLTVTWLDGEEEKTETRNLAPTIQQFITSDSYTLPEPSDLPAGFKFNGWYSDADYKTPISTINKSGATLDYNNIYGKVEPIQFKIIADCEFKDELNNSIECSYNELKNFHDECNISKLNDLCNDPNTNGYVLKVWKYGDEEINPFNSYLGSLSKTEGDEITLTAIYAPQYNICIIDPTDPTQCQKKATCFDNGEFNSAVYVDDVAAEGKVYSGAVKIGVRTSSPKDDAAKALSFTTAESPDEKINFTCSSDLVNTADNTIYIEYQYCSACAENTTATCTAAAALNSCSYNYTCNTGYTVPVDVESSVENSFVSTENNAQCEPIQYNVYLDPKSNTCPDATGSGVGKTANVASGTRVTTNDFSCSGKKLAGWSTDINATTATYNADSIQLNADDIKNNPSLITLYAVWADAVYNIKYKTCTKDEPNICLTWVNEPTKTRYVMGDTITLPAATDVTVDEYYELSGWQLYYNESLSQTLNEKFVPGGSLTGGSGDYFFVPVIEPIKYTMIPYMDGAQAGSPTSFDITIRELPAPSAPQKTGHNFIGWCFGNTDTCFTDGSIDVRTAVEYASQQADGEIRLNAKFEPNVYNLYIDYDDTTLGRKQLYVLYSQGIFSTNNNGTLSDKIESLPTPTRTGYEFTEYKNEKGETIKYSDALYITEDTRITAQWTPIVYPVNVNWNGNLIGVGDTIIFANETIYEKYGTGWYSDEATTEEKEISQLTIPNNDTVSRIYTFDGLYIGGEQIFDKDGKPIVNDRIFNLKGTDKLTAKWVKNCYPVTLYDTNTATDDTSIEVGTIYRAPECTNGECENAWFSDAACENSLTSVTNDVELQDLYSFRGWNSANNWTFEDGKTGMIFDEAGKPTKSANNFNGNALYSMESNKYTIELFASDASGWKIPEDEKYVTYTASDAAQTIKNLAYLYNGHNTYIHVGWSMDGDNENCSTSPLSYEIPSETAEDFILYPCVKQKENICLHDSNSILSTDFTMDSSYEKTSCTYYCKSGYYKSVAGQNDTGFKVQVGEITAEQACDPIEYTVTFNAGDGAFSDGGVTKTTTVTFNADTPDNLGNGYIPSLAGYTFNGWYYNDEMVYNNNMEPSSKTWIYSQQGSVDPNISLSPVWEANEYQINYTLNGGTLPSEYATTCKPDADVVLPTPERTGYTFSGWIFNGEPIDKISANSGVCVKDLTLVANWGANTYTIAFDADGGTLNPSDYKAKFTYDAQLPNINVTANRTDHIFTGWFDKNGTKYYDADNTPVKDKSNLLEDDSLSAGWTERGATQIELNLNGGSLNGYTVPKNCFPSSGTQQLPTANQVNAPVGYEFDGWTLDGTRVTNYVCDKESLIFTAQWKAKEFTVTFNGNGHTNGSMSSQEFVYNEPEYLANNVFEKTGYIFSGWAKTATGAKKYENAAQFNSETDGNDITLYAVWENIKYDITFDANGGVGIPAPNVSCEYDKKGCVAPGYNGMTNGTKYFVGWAYNKNATVPNFVETDALNTAFNAAGTHTLYAVWHECVTPEYDTNSVNRIDISVNKNSCQYAAKCNAGYFDPTVSETWADCTICPDNSSSSDNNSAKYCTCNSGYEYGTKNQTTTDACVAKQYDIYYGFIDTANWDVSKLPTNYTYGIGEQIPQLSRDGYIFNGWCTDSAKTDCALTQTISGTDQGQKTFWANVQPIKFTINYDGNGGTTADGEPYSTECTYDLPCQTAENKFINPGHKFVEWVLKDKDTKTFDEIANIKNLYKTETVATMHAKWDACTSLNDAECNCPAGTHPNNGECISCTKQCEGKFPDGEYNACAGETNRICKRPMHKDDIENSIFVDGTLTLGGMKDITQLQCADGYYPSESMDECLPCPAGSYCESGVGLKACPDSHPNSDVGASFDSECYKICTDSQIDGFLYQAITDKAYFDTKCKYSKVVTKYGTCAENMFDMDSKTCSKYETCAPAYNLISGQCKPCNIENAVSYSSGCIVQTCTNGYHPFADTCVSNEDECTIENASIAIKTWNESKGSYGICTVVECDEDFHIENNTCVSNYRECKSANGYGTQEWQKNNRWGDCIATKCNAGYELNGDKCVPCSNSNGVSSWINGCTIAACMYQGEQYNLENNECIEICTNTTDYTGTRKWNSTTKRCETSCADGYKKW